LLDCPPFNIDQEITAQLGRVAEFFGADLGAIWTPCQKEQALQRTIVHARPGQNRMGPDTVKWNLPWLTEELAKGYPVVWSHIPHDLPPEAAAERRLALEVGAKSSLYMPILTSGSLIWAIELTALRSFHVWSLDVEARVRAIGNVVGNALARKHAEVALIELGGRLIAAQEDERRRIARDLHDDFNQRLGLICLNLQQLDQCLPQTLGHLHAKTRELNLQLVGISSDIHRLSHELHPSKLEHLGLVEAVRGLCREMAAQNGLKIDFNHHEVPPSIPGECTLGLFRIAQEGLTNIVRHSHALAAGLELSGRTDSLSLCVFDNGKGFDPQVAEGKGGLGLVSMRERVRLLGGALSIESRPARGTRITARVPLANRGYGMTG